MNNHDLQYFCDSCQNQLQKIDAFGDVVSCPFCVAIASDTPQKQFFNSCAKPFSAVFKKASSLPKLTLDLPKLDNTLHFLTLNNRICIRGIHTQKLVERICVRAQLPQRYGGLDSKVLLIDGANSSDLYQCVDFARQYGLDANKILSGIISSRAFTVYQLANTIIKELQSAIKQHNVRVVIITHLLHYFTNDLDTNEMKLILKEVVKTLNKIQNCLVVVSMRFPTQYDYMFTKFFSRTIDIRQNYNILSVHIDDDGMKNSLLLEPIDLETIPQH